MSATARKRDHWKRFRSCCASLSRWLVPCVAVLVSSGAAIANEPKISVAPFVRVEAPSQAEFHVHIDWPTAKIPPNGSLIVVGLPKSVNFSAGSAAGGLWELPLTNLERLKINIPPLESNRANLSFYLVSKQQGGIIILASTRSVLAIENSAGPPAASAKAPSDGKRVPDAVVEPAKQPSTVRRDRVAKNDPAAEGAGKEPTAEERIERASSALEDARAKVAAKRAEAERLGAEAAKVEETRKAEEARIEEARRQIAAKQAEGERLAADAARVEEARKAEAAKVEEARRQVAARQAEVERLTAEAAKAEEARKAQEARVEDVRRQAAAKQAEVERLTAEATRAEQARKTEEARVNEVRRQAAAKQAEAERLAAEAAKAEEARKAEESRLAEVRRQAATKRAEAERVAAIATEKKAAEPASAAKALVAEAKGPDGIASVNTAGDKPELLSTPAQSERFLKKGDEYLSQGNLTIAREYFLRASRSGVAIAALKLAETYDPHELGRMNAHGLMPNIAEAKRWYLRAIELGSSEASAKLARLGD